jgi:hypothetical protein
VNPYQGLKSFNFPSRTAGASGAGGGDVQVTGRRVTLTGGSRIEANTSG